MMKFDLDTVPTVPAAPPAAGADRAFDPRLDPRLVAEMVADAGCPAEADEDVARPMDVPITEASTTTAAIDRLFLLDSHRRTLVRSASVLVGFSSFMVALL